MSRKSKQTLWKINPKAAQKSVPNRFKNRLHIGSELVPKRPQIDPKPAPNWLKICLGGVWGGLEAIFGGLGGSRAVLGGSRGVLGSSWGRLGAVLGPSWGCLGPSWGRLGPSWGLPGGSPGPPGEDFGVHFSSFSGLGLQAVWGSSFIRILSGFLSVLGE